MVASNFISSAPILASNVEVQLVVAVCPSAVRTAFIGPWEGGVFCQSGTDEDELATLTLSQNNNATEV